MYFLNKPKGYGVLYMGSNKYACPNEVSAHNTSFIKNAEPNKIMSGILYLIYRYQNTFTFYVVNSKSKFEKIVEKKGNRYINNMIKLMHRPYFMLRDHDFEYVCARLGQHNFPVDDNVYFDKWPDDIPIELISPVVTALKTDWFSVESISILESNKRPNAILHILRETAFQNSYELGRNNTIASEEVITDDKETYIARKGLMDKK
jgi:hypothetical protein